MRIFLFILTQIEEKERENKKKHLYILLKYTSVQKRRVQDLNLRAGFSRVGGFRVRCITTLPTLQKVYQTNNILAQSK